MGLSAQAAVLVRKFNKADREAVRSICCDTADLGSPLEGFYSDRKVVADLVTSYYTDYQSDATWVAVKDDRVIGYLTGCLDTSSFIKVMFFRIMPRVLIESIFRGCFFQSGSWRMVSIGLRSLFMGGFSRKIPYRIYSAHLHIDIIRSCRGIGIGKLLMDNFLQQATAEGVPGIHLSVRDDNLSARGFFESFGFKEFARYRIAIPVGKSFKIGYSVIYAKKL